MAVGSVGHTLITAASQMSLGTLIEKVGEIAVANELIEMGSGLEKKFNPKEILEQVIAAVALNKIAPAEEAIFATNPWLSKAIYNEIQSLFIASLKVVLENKRMNLANLTANAIGAAVGQQWAENMIASDVI